MTWVDVDLPIGPGVTSNSIESPGDRPAIMRSLAGSAFGRSRRRHMNQRRDFAGPIRSLYRNNRNMRRLPAERHPPRLRRALSRIGIGIGIGHDTGLGRPPPGVIHALNLRNCDSRNLNDLALLYVYVKKIRESV